MKTGLALFGMIALVLVGCGSTNRLVVPDPVAPVAYVPGLERVELLAALGQDAEVLVSWLSARVVADGNFTWHDRRTAGWSGNLATWPRSAIGIELAVVDWAFEPRGAVIDAEYWSSHGGPGRRMREPMVVDRASCQLTVTLVVNGQRQQHTLALAVVAMADPKERGVVYRVSDPNVQLVAAGGDLKHEVGRRAVGQLVQLFTPQAEERIIALAGDGNAKALELSQAGELMAAEAWLRRVIAERAQPADLFNLAVVLEAQGYHHDALPYYQAAVEAAPTRREWQVVYDAAAERSAAAAALSSNPLDQAL